MAELRHYRYFVEIARRGTVTAAAEALNMTQSALSEQILQLERECGSRLFYRRPTGIALTPAGEYLLHHAEALLAKAAEMREGLAGFRHGYQARLRIASILGPLQSWLPGALAQFVQGEPHVQLQVTHQLAVHEILAGVAGDRLDLGVVNLRPASPARSRHRELAEVVLMEEDMVVLVPPGHHLAPLAHVRQQDLCSLHLVTFPGDYNLRRIIEDWYHAGGCSPIVAAETGTLEVMLRLIAGGIGAGIVPRSLAGIGTAAGLSSVPLAPDGRLRRVVAAVHREDGPGLALVLTMVELMRRHAGEAARAATRGDPPSAPLTAAETPGA
jgi:DNA-binding transcriptional LysR family regulator